MRIHEVSARDDARCVGHRPDALLENLHAPSSEACSLFIVGVLSHERRNFGEPRVDESLCGRSSPFSAEGAVRSPRSAQVFKGVSPPLMGSHLPDQEQWPHNFAAAVHGERRVDDRLLVSSGGDWLDRQVEQLETSVTHNPPDVPSLDVLHCDVRNSILVLSRFVSPQVGVEEGTTLPSRAAWHDLHSARPRVRRALCRGQSHSRHWR